MAQLVGCRCHGRSGLGDLGDAYGVGYRAYCQTSELSDGGWLVGDGAGGGSGLFGGLYTSYRESRCWFTALMRAQNLLEYVVCKWRSGSSRRGTRLVLFTCKWRSG